MTERILAYVFLAFFFLMDFLIRKDKIAKSIDKKRDDNNSTLLILLIIFVVLILSGILNSFNVGTFNNTSIAIIGLTIMIIGILIRIHSMLTLSKFYTRTLITVDKQEIIKRGLYKIIRHPGYLGTILIWSAAGLAMQNIIVFVVTTLLILIAYYYRINNEERMLVQNFGDTYTEYKNQSWRLIPFIW
jgi:protein-S-isoprenylcysteine O-methyltransferase Ste14